VIFYGLKSATEHEVFPHPKKNRLALNIPMTHAIEEIFDFIGKTLDKKKVLCLFQATADRSRKSRVW
jgi:hypothetical protein